MITARTAPSGRGSRLLWSICFMGRFVFGVLGWIARGEGLAGPGVEVLDVLHHVVEGDDVDDVEEEAALDEEFHQGHELEIDEDGPVGAVLPVHDEGAHQGRGQRAEPLADGDAHGLSFGITAAEQHGDEGRRDEDVLDIRRIDAVVVLPLVDAEQDASERD